MEATASFLNDKGYAARWEKTPEGGYLLHTGNCPYQRVVQTHSEVCTMDANLVAQLVGVAPQRMSRMAAGGKSCTFLFLLERDGSTD